MITLVLGGTRSGKSRYAQQLARQLSERPLYVATSRPWDADHQARIARHQRERGPEWRTVECELELDSLPLQVRRYVFQHPLWRSTGGGTSVEGGMADCCCWRSFWCSCSSICRMMRIDVLRLTTILSKVTPFFA